MTPKLKKTIIGNIPYLFVALLASKLGLAWRLAEGADASKKMLSPLGKLRAILSPSSWGRLGSQPASEGKQINLEKRVVYLDTLKTTSTIYNFVI